MSGIKKKTLKRREFIKKGADLTVKSAVASSLVNQFPSIVKAGSQQPNVLFISIDDLNDFIEPLKGYPGVKTPNLKRLAAKCVNFTNAHTPVPACSSARSAVMFGIRPHKSGVYTLDENWFDSQLLLNNDSLPRYFKDRGFLTYGTGKVFHGTHWKGSLKSVDPTAWTHWETCYQSSQCNGPAKLDPALSPSKTGSIEYGPYGELSDYPDYWRARWMRDKILSRTHNKPFFAAIGINKPHTPFTVPKQFFDKYPLSTITYPAGVINPNEMDFATNSDTKDLPAAAAKMQANMVGKHQQSYSGDWKKIIQAYLATVSYADHCLGLVLDGLENGPNANNTYIVLWSDHGWQLGEKLAWHKFTLWERATRIPMMIGGPGITPRQSAMPVSAIDIYPTLTDLVFSKKPSQLDGNSHKMHLLHNIQTSLFALTSWRTDLSDPSMDNGVHFSVRTQNYRLIKYCNGDKELYDHRNDPFEWNNLLAGESKKQDRITANHLRLMIPKSHTWVQRA